MGAAVHREMAQGAREHAGWHLSEPRERDTSRGGGQPRPNESLSALCFDRWIAKQLPDIAFERYADDAICHCRSEAQARLLREALEVRLAACKLQLHPLKTKIVYCKDANRQASYPRQQFDFLGYTFR